MLDWLTSPIDAERAHAISDHIAWHARAMVLSWGGLVPVGILTARYFKVLPGQRWPDELDNRLWWNTHRACQYGAGVIMVAGLWLVMASQGGIAWLHGFLGWTAVTLAGVQFVAAWLRGTKGGPTAPAKDGSLRGDHYDMTTRRVVFEYTHKIAGYLALACAATAIVVGLWHVNGPRWMWITLAIWWSGLAVTAMVLQQRGRAVDTYQAIWGPDPVHPGNRRRPVGLGVTRPKTPD